METITLGNSDLLVSRIGFGCWQLGGHGWQDVDQREIEKAIYKALDLGINFFDTADIYGLGKSEELLAESLAKHPQGKNSIIATKFGVRNSANGTYYDNSSKWLHEALEGSLRRLKRDTIDLYQIHWYDGKRPITEIFEDLESLRKAGKIRWYGISNIPPSVIDKANFPAGLASFTLKYSLVQRDNEQEILGAVNNKKIGFIAWGALTQGLLSGKYNRHSTFAKDDVRSRESSLFSQKNWDYFEPILEKIKIIAEKNNKLMSQTALRFVLDFVPNSIVLAGIKTPAQLEENYGVLDWKLSAEHIEELKKVSAL